MKEADIRPNQVFEEYLRLSAADTEVYFTSGNRETIPCVGCANGDSEPAFQKSGFGYVVCRDCGTLYQSPRPPLEEFNRFYSDSPSSTYWATKFFPAVVENRRHLIFAKRVEQISAICAEKRIPVETVLDAGAGYGLFLEEWAKVHRASRLLAVEPSCELADVCRKKGFEVLETIAEKAKAWAGAADVVTCFEVIEHAHDPLRFVKSLYDLARPGGVVIVSGLGVEGFDIQVLWEHSKSVSPPHHINFMSVDGFETLFRRAGFADVEVRTPGKLDVDIVNNALAKDPEYLSEQRFVQTLMKKRPEAFGDFQELLARHRLSSHVWVIARRPRS